VEIRVIGRGALAGFVAGVLGFAVGRIWAEPVINKAIDYESGRDGVIDALNKAAGRPLTPDGPEVFSRSIQSTIGMATGTIGFATAMGALIAVAYLVLHGRVRVRPQTLVWSIAAFGFLGVYLLPFVKYPANPPAIGHDFTIVTRSRLYLTMVIASLVLLGLAVWLGHRLTPKTGMFRAANVAHTDQFGFARAATETPQPITNILPTPLIVDGKTIAPGQIVYPGFDPDVLWKFRWYSLLNQLLIWTTIAVIFGALLDRFVTGGPEPSTRVKTSDGPKPLPVA
jgi:predicted cobalt transporter CbtA